MQGRLRPRTAGERSIPPFVRTLVVCCVALASSWFCASASAAPVLVLRGDRVLERQDRFLPAGEAMTPPPAAPAGRARRAVAARAPAHRHRRHRRRGVSSELRRMRRAGAITRRDYRDRRRTWADVRRFVRKLSGRRRLEMGAVIDNVRTMAADGHLTVSRLPAVFLTLERNRQWWAKGRLLNSGERVEFAGSPLVWQEYYGQGLELQMLGNFGKANALFNDRSEEHDKQLEELLDALVPLAAERAGGLAWEYYFRFGGGVPPWTSAISQGTAIQALSRAAVRLDRHDYFDVGRRALKIFETPPPEGVRVGGKRRAFYLIYSFAPGQRVLNAFIQALNGLFDFAKYANDDEARALFDAGDQEAYRIVHRFDTGAWSLYSEGGAESDLNYHELVQGFLENLCERKPRDAYCGTAERFEDYLHQDPVTKLVTRRLRGGRPGALRFDLDKVSRVGVTVRRGDETVFATSARFPRGEHSVTWQVPRRAGRYEVTLYATGLAGNASRTTRAIRVLSPRRG